MAEAVVFTTNPKQLKSEKDELPTLVLFAFDMLWTSHLETAPTMV
jgi:hypothetical protein